MTQRHVVYRSGRSHNGVHEQDHCADRLPFECLNKQVPLDARTNAHSYPHTRALARTRTLVFATADLYVIEQATRSESLHDIEVAIVSPSNNTQKNQGPSQGFVSSTEVGVQYC